MSKCISGHGEYSEHEFSNSDDPYCCQWCFVVDEEAMKAKIAELESKLEKTRDQRQAVIDHNRQLIRERGGALEKVARVKALREKLAGYGPGTPMENVMGKQSVTVETLLGMLDAALAD